MEGRTTLVHTSLIYFMRDRLHAKGIPTASGLLTTGTPFYVDVINKKGFSTDMHLPSVVAYPAAIRDGGYVQIGGGKWDTHYCTVDVYAQRQLELYEITEAIREGFDHSTKVYNFSGGKYPEYSLNSGVIVKSHPNGSPVAVSDMWFENVSVTFPDDFPVNPAEANRAVFRVPILSARNY